MRRRWLVLALIVLTLAACAETNEGSDGNATGETESVTSQDPPETTTTTDDEPVDDSGAEEQSTDTTITVESTTSTTTAKTASTTASTAPPTDSTVPPAVAGSDFVSKAKADLADRIGVDMDAIAVVSVQEVDWPDRSFGCPEPDMVYAQIITNGTRIILSVDGTVYYYHSAGTGDPFYCANPVDPIPGSDS